MSGIVGQYDTVNVNNAHAYRKCSEVFLNKLVSQTLAIADFTDNEDATGYIDFDSDLPANTIVIGWKAVISEGFSGDTTAVMQVGVSGDLNKYSAITTVSCLAAATVGALGNVDTALATTAKTPRVTVTGGSDFGNISAGSMVVSLYYFLAW
ncbi:MAG: hypothetical protein JRI80_04925 [Deltaproteobacteria bacterium]|nr:hypothetical protein [Deltaproteobacteria bacterium]